MNKNQLLPSLLIILFTLISPIHAQEISKKNGDLYLDYKDKKYTIYQYNKGWDVFQFYSFEYWPTKIIEEIPEGMVLIIDNNSRVIKEIRNTNGEYSADMILYDINSDSMQDLILFWNAGAHSKYVEVWINKGNKDFEKVFEEFNDKNIFFTIRNGIPTIAHKKDYPMSATNDNFPDSDYKFYQWSGKTFVLKNH